MLCVHGAMADNTAPISITDSIGRTVTLNQPATRIVALAPHLVENVFSAGAGDKLVGAVNFSNYPEQAKSIPQVGGYHSFSMEAIVALKPDLVLMWAEGNSEDVAKSLSNLGLPVYINEPGKPETVAQTIRNIGLLAGTSAHANKVADEFLHQLTTLQGQYSREKPVSVFYQVWNKPLQTINGQHSISDVMALCGGRNVFADTPIIAPKVSIESVIARDPDAIIASGMNVERPEWLDDWRAYPQMSAVIHNNLYFVPPDILQRHTTRLLLGAEQVCASLRTVRDKWAQQGADKP